MNLILSCSCDIQEHKHPSIQCNMYGWGRGWDLEVDIQWIVVKAEE